MIALLAFMIFFTRHTALGGITTGLAWVTWISLAVVFVAMIAAHVAVGKQLMHVANGGGAVEV
jgi:hypothetical protein